MRRKTHQKDSSIEFKCGPMNDHYEGGDSTKGNQVNPGGPKEVMIPDENNASLLNDPGNALLGKAEDHAKDFAKGKIDGAMNEIGLNTDINLATGELNMEVNYDKVGGFMKKFSFV